jgi:hypothetical protein
MPRRNTNAGLRGNIIKECSPSAAHISLKKLSGDDLKRKRGLTAYEDGYADAREYGQDGFFMPENWHEELRLKYLAGFERGLAVHNARGGAY